MATGLTFGSISALYGLTNHLITQAQYSQLVTVVILSAFVPTLIAQQFFRPDIRPPPAGRRRRAGSRTHCGGTRRGPGPVAGIEIARLSGAAGHGRRPHREEVRWSCAPSSSPG